MLQDTAPLVLSEAQRVAWLRLIRSDNIGPRTFFGLLQRFGTARAALDALPSLAGRTAGRAVTLAATRDVEQELDAARSTSFTSRSFG